MASLYTYDPRQYVATITGALGVHVLSGFATGTFIEISAEEDTFSVETDINNNVGRTFNAKSKNAILKATFAQTSPSIIVLDNYRRLDSETLSGKFTFNFTDFSTGSSGQSLGAFVLNNDPKYATDNPNFEVSIMLTNCSRSISGLS